MRRQLEWLGIGVVAVVLLSACVPSSDIRARRGADGLEFLMCRSFEADTIYVYHVDPELGSDDDVLWSISGGPPIQAGDKLVYGELPDGWREDGPAAPVDPDDFGIGIALQGDNGTRAATFSAGSLGEGWRSETSSVSEEDPCG